MLKVEIVTAWLFLGTKVNTSFYVNIRWEK